MRKKKKVVNAKYGSTIRFLQIIGIGWAPAEKNTETWKPHDETLDYA